MADRPSRVAGMPCARERQVAHEGAHLYRTALDVARGRIFFALALSTSLIPA